MLKKLVVATTPPILVRTGSYLVGKLRGQQGQGISPDTLFDGDDHLFKQFASQAQVYAEYGCGASTLWVDRHASCRIISVDTSLEWLSKVAAQCTRRDAMALHHCDLGPLGAWGRPLGYERSEHFSDYTDWIWGQGVSPDLVLVDGRFRVCCFLTSLLNAAEGTLIIFDDYTNRAHYHFVERFLKPFETCGRQALFRVPAKARLDEQGLRDSISQFRYVFD